MEKAFKIIANSDNRDSLYNFIRQHDLDIGCTGGIRVKNHGFSVEIYAVEKEAIYLQKEIDEKELSKEIILDITDITDNLTDRHKEIGSRDRYKDGKEVPRGLGKKVKEY